jgi:hypothetical protein
VDIPTNSGSVSAIQTLTTPMTKEEVGYFPPRKDSTMRLQLLSCAIGLIAGIGSAFAQAPALQPAPKTTPLVAAPVAQTPAAPVQGVVSGNCVVAQGPGCAATTATKSRWKNLFCIGEGCANPVGCSNLAAERTFIFGSCRQFFNPGNDCGPCAHKLGNCSGASGKGGCSGCNNPEKHPCAGVTSHLNR